MEENHIARESALTPEAATDEPAPSFNSLEEEDAFWRGVTHGIRCAGREPAHPHMPANFNLNLTRAGASPGLVSGKLLDPWPLDSEATPRAPRSDGWTGERKRIFLNALAETGVVADACRAAGISREAAYSLRRRAEGSAFALGWDAAILIARPNLGDDVMSRARHGVVDRVYRNGELVAERHRYDNRLAMAVLTRLDRLAEGMGEGAGTARTIAREWDQFLDIVEADGNAEAFLRARRPRPQEAPAAARDVESSASTLARLAAYRRYAAGLPHEIRTGDLDPAAMAGWTSEQWARAEHSGFLGRLGPGAWPECGCGGGEAEANGMCQLCQHKLAHCPAAAEPEEDFEGCDVWDDDDGELVTDFPPPPGFEGWEEGEAGEEDYKRSLTEEELAAVGEDPETLEQEQAEHLARQHAARIRFFGLDDPCRGSDRP